MKRLTVHLVTGMLTFFIGIAAELILTANRPTGHTPQPQPLKPVSPNVSESPPRFGITLPAPELIFDYAPEEFNPRGDYYILGRKPKDFREFDCLELAADESKGRAKGVVMIQTFSDQTYHAHDATSGLVTSKRLTFATTPLSEEDFEYRFDGHFLRSGVVSDAGKNKPVLTGKLSKFKGGVKIAECEVGFRVEYLGC